MPSFNYAALSDSSREGSRRSSIAEPVNNFEEARRPSIADESVKIFTNSIASRCRSYVRRHSTNPMHRFWYSNSNNAAKQMVRLAENFNDGDGVYRLLADLQLRANSLSELRRIFDETTRELFDSSEYTLVGYRTFYVLDMDARLESSLRDSGLAS